MTSFKSERVTHKINPNISSEVAIYIPQITTLTTPRPPHTSSTSNPFEENMMENRSISEARNQSSTEVTNDFKPGDILRVMDFDNLPDPPNNLKCRLCLQDFHNKEDNSFPERFIVLRGSYLFFFECSSSSSSAGVNQNNNNYHDISYILQKSKPMGCIPLSRTKIEFPDLGRRCFRQHMSATKSGYEFVISHTGDEPSKKRNTGAGSMDMSSSTIRPPVYIIVDSITQREKWASAIRLRAEIRKKDTALRPDSVANINIPDSTTNSALGGTTGDGSITNTSNTDGAEIRKYNNTGEDMAFKTSTDLPLTVAAVAAVGQDNSVIHEPFLKDALDRFGNTKFIESDWVNHFYEHNNEFDAPKQCRKLEEYQMAVKQGLRGAVLEQYEYFVEASREMTTMGKEVNSLKSLVEGQVRLVDQMKAIEFSHVFRYGKADGYSDSDSSAGDKNFNDLNDANSLISTDSSGISDDENDDDDEGDEWSKPTTRTKKHSNIAISQTIAINNDADVTISGSNAFEIPSWLGDVTEDISAYIRECRYTDATDLILKAKAELADITLQHEKLTDRKLTIKQLNHIHHTNESIVDLTKRMSERICEALRRKNEAFKQLSKRERADPLSEFAPLLSPICLRDDDTSLQLLVKLGYYNNAAEAYSSRRSLLLMESLNERSICSEGRLDLVINAAQLSQSFFSCLAMAVEGFLDLFIMGSNGTSITSPTGEKYGSTSMDDTSIQSSPSRKVPPGALGSIILWCDSELVKFANTFGGPKILGQLDLKPPLRAKGDKYLTRNAEEKEEFVAAATLRKKLGSVDDGSNTESGSQSADESKKVKERKMTINVAAQCIDQVFRFASENLDSIGLPLTARLAVCLRPRLKGCEPEVAQILDDRWGHFVFDWFEPTSASEEIGNEPSVASQWRRHSRNNESVSIPDKIK